MHVYLVSRSSCNQPTEIQLNVEPISQPQLVVPVLNRCVMEQRYTSKMVSSEFAVNNNDCVMVSLKNASIIAHPAFPAYKAAHLLNCINKGEPLISVLHDANKPLSECQESAEECLDILRTNLESMVRRGGRLEDLLRASDQLSCQDLNFKRYSLRQADPWCCKLL